MKKSCCLFVAFFLLSLLICTGDYLFFFYLTHGVIFILELQSPLNSGPSSCLGILSSSEHVDFFPLWATWRKWSIEIERKKKKGWAIEPLLLFTSQRGTQLQVHRNCLSEPLEFREHWKEVYYRRKISKMRELRFSLMQGLFFKVTSSRRSKNFWEFVFPSSFAVKIWTDFFECILM